ncbi:MAG: FAD-dependent oxidoreductase [Duodenibacillus sp.]|nr:FAD-dependent oxidoreductase [Duodenibacillus sp.]
MPLDSLMSPFSCGQLQLATRFAMAPVMTGLERTACRRSLHDFYLERARKGVGMITVSGAVVHKTGVRRRWERVFDEALDAPRHKLLTDELRACGCRSVLQLVHAGPEADARLRLSATGGIDPVTGKRVRHVFGWCLDGLIKRYAAAAGLAMLAGYDGVEVDASGRSLIAQFISPVTNRRGDKWGRNQLARFKLALDVVCSVRKRIGPGKLIGFRFNLAELSPQGADWSETSRLVQMLRIAGVDYLCPEFGSCHGLVPQHPFLQPEGAWAQACEALADSTDLAVALTSPPESLQDAEQLALKHGNLFVELKRPLLADPAYILKSAADGAPAVNACIGCFCGCLKPAAALAERIDEPLKRSLTQEQRLVQPIACLVNPELFPGLAEPVERARRPKRICVVGAGVAGIAFSLAARRRGHDVALFEAADAIGGQVRMLAKVPGFTRFALWLDSLERQLLEAGVALHKGRRIALTDLLPKGAYDLVVAATGAVTEVPDIPGINSSNVLGYEDLFGRGASVGNRVAVLGFNHVSLAIAKFLADTPVKEPMTAEAWLKAWGVGDVKAHRGGVLGVIPQISAPQRTIYLLERSPRETAWILSDPKNDAVYRWLRLRGVQTITGHNIELIDNYSFKISRGDQRKTPFTARIDHFVNAWGLLPNTALSEDLERSGFRHRAVGSVASEDGYDAIEDIIRQAQALAREV